MGIFNLSNGCSNDVIKYINGTSLSMTGRMINIAQSTAALGGNNNNVIDHDSIDGGSRGIQTFGTPGVNTNDNTVITHNKITNANTLAVLIGSELNGVTCDSNDVSINRGLQAAVVDYRTISVQGSGTIQIRKNMVHDLTNSTAASTYNYVGIITIPQPNTTGTATAVINIINNCVTLMNNNLNSNFIYGIFPASNGTSPASVQNIYHNTSRIGGAGVVTSAGAYYAAMPILVTKAGSTVNSYNNIAQNERTASDGTTTFSIGYDLTSYPAAGVTLNSDYNNGYSVVTNTGGWSVGYGSTVYRTDNGLANYKVSTCAVLIEQHTSVDSVTFTGLNSCIMLAGSVCGNMCGKTGLVPPVPVDILNTVRSTTYPYKGCWEGPALKILTITGCLEGNTTTGEIRVTLLSGCTVVCSGYADLDPGTNTAKVCFGDKITNGGAGYRLSVTSLNHIQTFSLGNAIFSPSASYNFPVGGAFGGNLTTGGCFFGGDANRDSTIDLGDLTLIYNDAGAFTAGCRLKTDINSDGFVDLSDLTIAFNNSSNFVGIISPCPEPSSDMNSNKTFSAPKSKIINTDTKNINWISDY